MFHTLKPLEEDLDDSVVVLVTPEGITWNHYNKTYVENKALMTNAKDDLLPSEYICHDLMVDVDYPSIDLVLVMDNPFGRFDINGTVSAVELLYKQSSPLDPLEMPFHW